MILQPQDIPSEEALIGAILLDKESMDAVSSELVPDDFYKEKNKEIFKVALSLFKNNEPVDLVTVGSKLKDSGLITYLAKIVDTVPMAINAVHYAQIIKEKSSLRRLILESNKTINECYQGSKSVNDILEESEKAISIISDDQNRENELLSNSSIAMNILNKIDSDIKSGRISGLSTGISRLDLMLGGIQPAGLYILAARPSMGKTSLAANIAESVSIDNGGTLFMSYETSATGIGTRLIAKHAKVNSMLLKEPSQLTKNQLKDLNDGGAYFSELNMTIDDTMNKNVSDIRRLARKLKKEKNLKLIIIDYLTKMPKPKAERNDLSIGEITGGLKRLCNELNTPVLLLAQLNRDLEKRDNKRPKMSDLRDSGSIEQDADVIMFIYRDIVYKEEADPLEAEIIIAKNRDGDIGMVKAKYVKELTTFSSFYEND